MEGELDCTLATPLLRELFRAEAGGSDWFSDDGSALPVPMPGQLETAPATFPEGTTRDQLVDIFFELTEFSCPILHRPSFVAQLAGLGHPGSQKAAFFAHMVFAISLLTLQKHNTTSISTSLCERHFASALHNLEKVGLPADVEGAQALLLISLYSYLHPRSFNPWKTIGMAVRLATSLGLHTEPSSGDFDPLTLDIRRRVFWVAYSMDRTVGTLLRRPFGIPDSAISAEFPSPIMDDYITIDGILDGPTCSKAFALQYFELRRLQSEIHSILYEKPPLGYFALDYGIWQRNMHARILRWHSNHPNPNGQAASNIAPPEVLNLAYHQALIALYRPSPSIPEPGEPGLVILANAAIEFIEIYRRLHRENKLRLFWQAVHNLFASGTALLYCYAHSLLVREQITLRKLEASVHACSAAMWAMVERFPSAKGKRDAFDSIATAALDSLPVEAARDYQHGDGRAARQGLAASLSPGDSIPELEPVVSTGLSQWTSVPGNHDPLMEDFMIDPALFENGQNGLGFWLG